MGTHRSAGEIRIDYDKGATYNPLQPGTLYWPAGPPLETKWRSIRLPTPPPTAEEPLIDMLAELQMTAAAGRRAPPFPEQLASESIPWEGAGGGDSRLKAVVPMLRPRVASRPSDRGGDPLVRSVHACARSLRQGVPRSVGTAVCCLTHSLHIGSQYVRARPPSVLRSQHRPAGTVTDGE